ncbi:unnamed protein product [Cyberlindnera jadinii]|uniref:Exocyst complex component SEC15 n=1 Tax=Cyberlindnera jadinii (strain ATCC 18201 / CBS 1600 / BCRC 20928 / JCM 3617 / NBRC 0987 / NRRL Y-1542) TaxID=983966 RepID=A0A0H5CA54_CYBJN|nr:hypothetical protein CYBJADRAFT_167266 [Cyberlindnera jadinii NRRL Y-1542]ODV73853.1 hypothetical protein CYBJADRAFT_167266 [Cyberlindnera jadinii NRRL Y-1542]CEP25112.1 unnamed protein product [Cyberlindnera jadinii]
MADTADTQDTIKQLTLVKDADPMSLLSSNNYLEQLVPIIKTHLKENTVKDLVAELISENERKDDELVAAVSEKEESINIAASEIAEISTDAASMNDQIKDIGGHLAKTSNLTFEKKFQLLALKKDINKIQESEILLNKVLQVLELTDRTHTLIKENKFFSALKNLNDLNALDKDFDRDFQFLKNINESIPILKNLIKNESISLLKRDLGTLDSKFGSFGEEYFNAYASLITRWEEFKTQRKEYERFKINSPVEISLRSSYVQNELPHISSFIKFTFIYDTHLIFQTLGEDEILKYELNSELSRRREKVFYPFVPSDSKNLAFQEYVKDNEKLLSFMQKLTGYLIFYRTICARLPETIAINMNDLWENLSAKICTHLRNLILNEVREIPKITEIKRMLGIFCLILERYDMNHDQFYSLLIICYKKYTQLANFAFTNEFVHSAEDDDSMPMSIYDAKLYKKITSVCWYDDDRSLDQIKFPLTLPFSTIYPMACAQVRNYMTQQNAFLKEYYKYDTSSVNRMSVENIDNVLLNAINNYYVRKLKDSLTREELSQNLINLEYFLIMSKEISQDLSEVYEMNISLKAIEAFSKTRKDTEQKMMDFVDSKMGDLLELIDWDWTGHVVNSEPTFFIRDISDFLQNLFNSALLKLPLSVKTLLLFRAFDLIAKEFWGNMMEQPRITRAAVANFDRDICYIEAVTKELNPSRDQNTSRDSLQSMFVKLRQAINLLKQGNLNEYQDQSKRLKYFDQLKAEEAYSLINKLRI